MRFSLAARRLAENLAPTANRRSFCARRSDWPFAPRDRGGIVCPTREATQKSPDVSSRNTRARTTQRPGRVTGCGRAFAGAANADTANRIADAKRIGPLTIPGDDD